MDITKATAILLLTASFTTVFADEKKDASEALAMKMQASKIDAMKKLPGGGFSIIKAGEQTFLISENGRFAIRNPVVMDLWAQKKITSFDEASDVDKIDLKKIGVKDEDLSFYTYGTGSKEVTVFVDPRCPHCSVMTNQMAAMKKDYKFKIIVLPLLGEDSSEIVKRMECANNNQMVVDAMLAKNYANLPPSTDGCSMERLKKTIIVSNLIGVRGVPFTIMPNGKTFPGRIDDFKTAIERNVN